MSQGPRAYDEKKMRCPPGATTGASWGRLSRVSRMPRPTAVSKSQRSGGSGSSARAATAVPPSGDIPTARYSPAGPTVASSLPERSYQTIRVVRIPARWEYTSSRSEAEKNGDPGAVKPSMPDASRTGSPLGSRVFGSQATAIRLFVRPKRR